jgi:hypothetical protein
MPGTLCPSGCFKRLHPPEDNFVNGKLFFYHIGSLLSKLKTCPILLIVLLGFSTLEKSSSNITEYIA